MRRMATMAGLLLLLAGCDLLGPSPEDVKGALDAVVRGVNASTSAEKKPEVHSEYVNKGDLTYTSYDGTTVHNMGFFIDTDTQVLKIKGDCGFTNYHDAASGYTLNGEIDYSLDGIRKTGPEGMFGDIRCKVSLAGGKIRTIDLKVSRGRDGMITRELIANDRKIDLEEWDKVFRMFNFHVPGNR